MPLSADDLIADILGASPEHRRGTRPIHAPGIAATGVFQATDVAQRWTAAEHFGGQTVPVTVRFSNGTGQPAVADADPALVRGMAIKFHVGADSSSGVVDMVCMTLPLFFIRTVERFPEFARAATPVEVGRRPWWRKRLADLALRTVPADPPPRVRSSALGMYDFARRYPPAAPAVVASGMLRAPASYSTCSYHAVHAFIATATDGTTRAVRFNWEPVDGVRAAPAATRGLYLQDELEARLRRSAVEFVLRMQVGEGGDDASDPTVAWPVARQKVVMGHLLLHTLAPVDVAENSSFNPTRLTAGIAMSDDPTLRVRGPVYERSFDQRRAERSGSAGNPTPQPLSAPGR